MSTAYPYRWSRSLGEAVRSAAAGLGQSISAWISDAATDRLLNERLSEALDAWEAEHGDLTEDELKAAEGRIIGSRAVPHRRD